MKFPKPLQKNAVIGLIAPCSPIKPDRLVKCVNAITALGYNPILGESVKENLHGYLAGSDEVRANDINQMFLDSSIDAIFCLRGGYGSTRIMKQIDYRLIKNYPKIFTGYSDVTSFHLAFYSLCEFATFHGPMVASNIAENFDDYTRYSFFENLSIPVSMIYHHPKNKLLQSMIPGKACGRLIGGCLSLVCASIGTFYQPNYCGTILFLEEIDETVPRIDRMMQQLKNSGILLQVSGIILGNFTNCKNLNDESYSVMDFFFDFFQDSHCPIVYNVASGHDRPMATLPFGSTCTIDTEKGEILFMNE